MLLRSVKAQIYSLLQQKKTVITFFLLLGLIVANFIFNVIHSYGAVDVTHYNPMRLLSLSHFMGDYFDISYYIAQTLPITAIIPAALSYIKDRNSRELIYIQSKVGAGDYYYGKLIAIFVVTFFIFAIPFLMEVALDSIAFPSHTQLDPNSPELIDLYKKIPHYLFGRLYNFNIYLYAAVFVCVFSFAAAAFACFAHAFSTFGFVKFGAFVFVPVYCLLYVIYVLGDAVKLHFTTYYPHYLILFNSSGYKSGKGMALLLILMLLFSIVVTEIKCRKDCLN